jgi:hypothetical protein
MMNRMATRVYVETRLLIIIVASLIFCLTARGLLQQATVITVPCSVDSQSHGHNRSVSSQNGFDMALYPSVRMEGRLDKRWFVNCQWWTGGDEIDKPCSLFSFLPLRQ